MPGEAVLTETYGPLRSSTRHKGEKRRKKGTVRIPDAVRRGAQQRVAHA